MGRKQRSPARIARQSFFNPIDRVFPPSNLRQYSVGFPYLLFQEAVGFTLDHYAVFGPFHFPPHHLPHRAAVLRMPRRQGPEVMDAHQKLGRLGHPLGVEALPDPKVGVPPQWRRRRPVQYAVLVGPAQGAPAGVKIVVNPVGFKNIDVLGKMIIQRGGESVQWMLGSGEEIDHLALGMGPGIGAAGASDPGWLAREPGQGLFQLTLNRRMAGLKLESRVPGPLVFNQKGGPPKLPARSVI